jgi:hypothetical protein
VGSITDSLIKMTLVSGNKEEMRIGKMVFKHCVSAPACENDLKTTR